MEKPSASAQTLPRTDFRQPYRRHIPSLTSSVFEGMFLAWVVLGIIALFVWIANNSQSGNLFEQLTSQIELGVGVGAFLVGFFLLAIFWLMARLSVLEDVLVYDLRSNSAAWHHLLANPAQMALFNETEEWLGLNGVYYNKWDDKSVVYSRAGQVFLGIKILQGSLLITLVTKAPLSEDRIIEIEEMDKGLFANSLYIDSPAEIDDGLKDLVEEAIFQARLSSGITPRGAYRSPTPRTPAQRLVDLTTLKDKGVISEEEYHARRTAVLDQI
jgi:hypothetical protein